MNPLKWLGFPFDSEIFLQMWQEIPDPELTALLESGIIADNNHITQQLSGGGNLFTAPFYNTLTGTPTNLDGQTDIGVSDLTGSAQSGMAFRRAYGWTKNDFQQDLSGNDPMRDMAARVARFWNKYRQRVIIGILDALYKSAATDTNTADFKAKHTHDTGAAIAVTDINEAATKALGDNKGALNLVVMHSQIAKRLENLRLTSFYPNTNAEGIQGALTLPRIGGMLIVIDDGVPVNGTKYTTYLLGRGAIQRGHGKLDEPATEIDRDPGKKGGQTTMYTRISEVYHPNGFNFTRPKTGFTESPTDVQLFDGANWSCMFNPKAIPIVRLITDEKAV